MDACSPATEDTLSEGHGPVVHRVHLPVRLRLRDMVGVMAEVRAVLQGDPARIDFDAARLEGISQGALELLRSVVDGLPQRNVEARILHFTAAVQLPTPPQHGCVGDITVDLAA